MFGPSEKVDAFSLLEENTRPGHGTTKVGV